MNLELVQRRNPPKGYSVGRNIVKKADWKSKDSCQAVMADNIEIMKTCHVLPDVVDVAPLMDMRTTRMMFSTPQAN